MINSRIYYDDVTECLYFLDETQELQAIPPSTKTVGMFHHIDNAYTMPWYTLEDAPRLHFEHIKNLLING